MQYHSLFPARISSTCEQLFRADELPKMALERKKQTGSCLTFFQMKKQTLISWFWLARVEAFISFYTKSPVMITHCSLTLYHRSCGSDVCFRFSSINSQLWTAGAGAVPGLTYGERQEKVFLVFLQITCAGITWKGWIRQVWGTHPGPMGSESLGEDSKVLCWEQAPPVWLVEQHNLSVTVLAQAAFTKHHRLGSLKTTDIPFSRFWRLGSPG